MILPCPYKENPLTSKGLQRHFISNASPPGELLEKRIALSHCRKYGT